MLNNIKTVMLLAVMTALLLAIGQLAGGRSGLVIALVFALLFNFFSYWYSDKLVLAMYRAVPMDVKKYPGIGSAVEELSANAGVPVPRIYVIPQDIPNAFATGRNPANSAIALTEGILRSMDRNQLKGVIAHEMSHIKHRDILISTVAATLAGAIGFLASMARWAMIFGGGRRNDRNAGALGLIVAAVVAPLAAMIIQMAVSRSREFEADREAAVISGNPAFLIGALRKLAGYSEKIEVKNGNPVTAHLFIVNPFKLSGIRKMFSTHPAVEERIKRLESYRA
ncbi:MAG: zinc metalloprotease HtpX [Elusimicrobia bacterium]|nr:zinc metalloprotease HtpX [Elusimicrobiota bacterium]